MRKHLIAAGLAAATLIPSIALAQTTCEQRRDNRVAGTLAGAGVGALLGSAIAGHDRTAGAIVGGIGGAVVGNQLTKPNADCAHAYGYYDSNRVWHANALQRAQATGYYDNEGKWIDGAPNGYYDGQGRWVVASGRADAAGYYDAHQRWIPASSNGYYDTDGQFVAGAASGHYDSQRHWVSTAAAGRYDANGHWTEGEPAGHRDAQGLWIAEAQPGYYDANRRWVAGPAVGYYDTAGQWIATAPAAAGFGADASYVTHSNWDGAPMDARSREAWLEERIRHGERDGRLGREEATNALSSLDTIRRGEMGMRRHDGQLSDRDEANVQAQLDNLNGAIHWIRRDGDRIY